MFLFLHLVLCVRPSKKTRTTLQLPGMRFPLIFYPTTAIA